VDLHLDHHFSLRLVEADYLPTTFANGVNGRQNNPRIGAGVAVRPSEPVSVSQYPRINQCSAH
jgi:hypothetical protein